MNLYNGFNYLNKNKIFETSNMFYQFGSAWSYQIIVSLDSKMDDELQIQ